MSAMEWNDSYSVKVSAFDNQHKQLFVYFNEFYDAMTHDRGQKAMVDVLQKCCTYAVTHFRDEEVWMEKNKYPGFKEHREQHRAFAEKATKMLEDCRSGKLVVSGAVSKMIREWLVNHIMGSDKKYAEFAVKNGIKG